jgi:rhodanese-related sulfurtransferase
VRALPVDQRLGLVALALGLLALPARPYAGARVTLDLARLASLVEGEADHVTPQQLAEALVEGRSSYRLIDLREASAYAAYHIPSAENLPLRDLVAQPLSPTETLLVYSDDGTHGAQAWLLLKAKGLRAVYNLRGGLEGWKDEVVFPTFPESPKPEDRVDLERRASLSRYFGGAPRVAGGPSAGPAPDAPRIGADPSLTPSLPGGSAMPAKKKRREGG